MSNMSEPTLPDATPGPHYRLITSTKEYLEASTQLIANAERTLCIFDPDGQQLGFGTPAVCEQLRAFVSQGIDRRLNIVVHALEHLSQSSSRFLALLQMYPDRIIVNRTDGDGLRAEDCFVVADEIHCVRRPVAAQRRGAVIEHDSAEVARQLERFAEIWTSAVPGLTATTLGL